MQQKFKDIKIPFYPNLPEVFVKPYTSGTEKTSLEIRTVLPDVGNAHFDAVCNLFEVPKEFSDDLKIAYLYKLREVSLGSDLEMKWKCPHCKKPTEGRIFLEDLLIFPDAEKEWTLEELEFLKTAKPAEVVSKFFPDFLEKFSKIPEIFQKYQEIKSKLPRLKQSLECTCLFCQGKNHVKISDKEFCMNSLSERTIQTLYQAYFFLVQNGFSKSDVDSMFPFEREIQLSFVDEKIQKAKDEVKEFRESLKR